MKPIKWKHSNKVYAENQKEYMPLPALTFENDSQGNVISCWRLNWREKLLILFTGKVYLNLLSFNKPLTPSYLAVNRKEIYAMPDDKIKWWERLLFYKKN